jgi:predicted Zn-dependent protease
MKKRFIQRVSVLVAGGLCAGLMTSCETLNQLSEAGTSIAVASGAISSNEARSINRSVKAVGKTFEDISPEQEYYIGRSVAATLLGRYKPYDDANLNHYVNVLGQTLSRYSSKPETFGGYHFLVFDADEVNAFAAPGGLILVSKGLLKCCSNEDELAAVLAHEIGHVQNEDGLRAISKSRLTSALTILASEGAKNLGGEQLAQVTEAFEGSVNDITQTLVVNGYSRRQERQADEAAVSILKAVGYDPDGLIGMLNQMSMRLGHSRGGIGFAKTHPDPLDRVADVQRLIGSYRPVAELPERQIRFDRAMAGLLRD